MNIRQPYCRCGNRPVRYAAASTAGIPAKNSKSANKATKTFSPAQPRAVKENCGRFCCSGGRQAVIAQQRFAIAARRQMRRAIAGVLAFILPLSGKLSL